MQSVTNKEHGLGEKIGAALAVSIGVYLAGHFLAGMLAAIGLPWSAETGAAATAVIAGFAIVAALSP